MLGLPTLDVAIGVAFFYLIFSLICTTANEAIARWLQKRPKTLEEAIHQLLGNKELKDAIFNHPLVCTLSRTVSKAKAAATTELPSYIPSATFATALLDQLAGANKVTDLAALETTIKNAATGPITLPNGTSVVLPRSTQVALETLLQKANGKWDAFHAEIESWYNATMDRAEGWYKRYVQKQTYLLAIVIVLWADFDTLQVARRLWMDSALRAAVVEQARHRTQAESGAGGALPLVTYTDPEKPDQGTPVKVEPEPGKGVGPLTPDEQTMVGSATGWQRDLNELPDSHCGTLAKWLLMHLFGWGVSVLAISLGAPFWFDVLNRFMNLRNAGRAPDEPRAKNAGSGPAPSGVPQGGV